MLRARLSPAGVRTSPRYFSYLSNPSASSLIGFTYLPEEVISYEAGLTLCHSVDEYARLAGRR